MFSLRTILPALASLASLTIVAACAAPSASDAAPTADAAPAIDAGPDAEAAVAGQIAGTWLPVLSCDGGAAVLDVRADERRELQLVIRDSAVLTHFAPFEFFTFGQREFIVSNFLRDPLRLELSDPTGPKLVDAQLTGVFEPSDFRFFIGNARVSRPNSTYAGRFYSVFRQGEGVRVELKEIKLNGCAGEVRPRPCGESYGCGFFCDGPDFTSLETLVSWDFARCTALLS